MGEGNGNPLQCSCLENPRDRGAWWAAIYGVAQSWTWLKRLSSSSKNVQLTYGLPWWLSGEESTWNEGDMGLIPGSRRFPKEGNGNPLQYSCLENPMDRGAWWGTWGHKSVGHNLVTKQQQQTYYLIWKSECFSHNTGISQEFPFPLILSTLYWKT